MRHVLGELHITTIAVRPEYRRRGHARALIGAALAAYPRATYVHLEVRPTNGAAISLYESLGFRATGRRPRYYGDEDALLMTLNLDRIVLRTPALLALPAGFLPAALQRLGWLEGLQQQQRGHQAGQKRHEDAARDHGVYRAPDHVDHEHRQHHQRDGREKQ